MKRFLAGLLVFIMLLAMIAPVIADSDYSKEGKILEELGLLKGDGEDLMLNKNLNRQDMVVLISRLYKKEDVAKSYVGKNVFKDLTPARRFYIPYINWAKDEGLIVGMEKDEFGFNQDVTVQQFQTVLLRALGYGDEAKNWDQVPEIARVMGIMDNLDIKASSKLSRGQLSIMVLNTLKEDKKGLTLTLAQVLELDIPELFKVDFEIKTDLNNVTFKGHIQGVSQAKLFLRPNSLSISSGQKTLDITIDKDGNFEHVLKDLEAGSYEYRFESSKGNTDFKTFKIDDVSFEFIEAKASNLKEISLLFTQAVDMQTASFVSNYSTTAGSIKDVRFEDNNKKVILTLNGVMTDKSRYKVSLFKIKSAKNQELTIKDVEFTASDKDRPEVEEIIQLGNTGLKIVFSEPIKSASHSNFEIDGKSIFGNLELENNVVLITYYSSNYALDEGKHELRVKGIIDYAGYEILDRDISFNITRDRKPPVVINQSATLDEVIIEFDEDIDPVSDRRSNFYWKKGSSKRTASSVKFIDNKAYLNFEDNRLPEEETIIYIEDVEDYSGNAMRVTEVRVNPIVDKTRPEVVNYKVAGDFRSITVYYSKNVNGKNRSNYSLKDQNDRSIYIRDIQGSDREFTIHLSTPLPIGNNSLTIDGVEDTTSLRNILVPYSTKIDMEDIEKPKILNHTGHGNYIMIQFSKKMDPATITNYDNYYINFDGSINYLPRDSSITSASDGKSVTILLPKTINSREVVLGTNLTFMEIRGLKDTMGNDTDPLLIKLDFKKDATRRIQAVDYYNNKPGKKAALVDEDTIKIKFNVPIIDANRRDFSVDGRSIRDIKVDNTHEITLYLKESDKTSIPDGSLKILKNNDIKTAVGSGVEYETLDVVDEVPPRVKYGTDELYTTSDQIELPFTENLAREGSSLYRKSLEIIREEDGKILKEEDFSTSLGIDRSILIITIENREISSEYSVRVIGKSPYSSSPSYIRDEADNLALDSGIYYRSDMIYKR